MSITREQAICWLFCEEINEDSISGLTKRIDSMKVIEVCYEKSPQQPRLIPLMFLHTHLSRFQKYTISSEDCAAKAINGNH